MGAKERIIECEKMIEKAAVEKNSAMLKKLLGKAVLFRNFSPRNSILIAQQCPEATMVMGKKAWKKFGVKPRNDSSCIFITGIAREFVGDAKVKKAWFGKNPFRKIDLPEILPTRLYALREGAKPTEAEIELASQKNKDFRKEYDEWVKSKPKELKTNNYYIPVKVYDISQCEIFDEEKFKTLPRPSVKAEMPEEIYAEIENLLKQKGYSIDGTSPTTVGRAVHKTVLIDGQATEEEKLFQITQAWASTKTNEMHEAVLAAAMFLIYSGHVKTVSDSVLETAFLKAGTQRAMSSAITKAGNIFRKMADEFEEFIEKRVQKEINETAEDMDLVDIY